MAKKKRLNNALNDIEKEFIEEKMKRSGNSAHQMMETVGYTRQLKTLNYKIDIKCKNKKQKDFLQHLRDLNLKLNICFRAFRAQNRGFCALLGSETPVFGLFEHKIGVFVRCAEGGEGGGV